MQQAILRTARTALSSALVVIGLSSVPGLVAPALAATAAASTTAPAGLAVSGPASIVVGGRTFVLGGTDAAGRVLSAIQSMDAKGVATTLPVKLLHARTRLAATVLADGRVLVLGGVDASGRVVIDAEVLDLDAQTAKPMGSLGLIARASHTATVLADARVLVAGGVDARGAPVMDVELWDPKTNALEHLNARLDAARVQHLATLLPTSQALLWGGLNAAGQPAADADVYDAVVRRLTPADAATAASWVQAMEGPQAPTLVASVPAAEARNVAGDQPLSLRFGKRLDGATLNASTVTLIGPAGAEAVKVVTVERGVMAFVWPQKQLLPASRYTLFVNGAVDTTGQRLPLTAIGFDTSALVSSIPSDAMTASSDVASAVSGTAATAAKPAASAASATGPRTPWFLKGDFSAATRQRLKAEFDKLSPAERQAILDAELNDDPEEWIPTAANFTGRWTADRGRSPMQNLPARRADANVTAVSGQVLSLHGRPMPDVTLRVDGIETKSDVTGRFVLSGLSAGGHVLEMDGSSANRPGARYGYYATHVDLVAGQDLVLPYTIFMPRLDPQGVTRLSSPTTAPVVATTPRIPYLEVHLPTGTVIRGREGRIITEINITPIPVDRPPFPLPGLGVPVYFTVQPGAAVIQGTTVGASSGAQIYYPNFNHEVPKARGVFWNYDAVSRGWFVYGLGTINEAATQAVPNPGVVIHEFTGAMFDGGSAPPPAASHPCPPNTCCPAGSTPPDAGGGGGGGGPYQPSAGSGSCGNGGDPVNLYTGQFEFTDRDMFLPDVVPIDLTRTYRAADRNLRAFGVGMTHPYDVFFYSQNEYQEVDLYLPNGAKVHYVRISPGVSWSDAVFQTTVNGRFAYSTVSWNTSRSGWDLKFRDGNSWFFPDHSPIAEMTDPHGNITHIVRDTNQGHVIRLESPNGRVLTFQYNGNLIGEIDDNTGRKVVYTYDTSNRLHLVSVAGVQTRRYEWDTSNRIVEIYDANDTRTLLNEYNDVDTYTPVCNCGTSPNCFCQPPTAFTTDRISKQTLADGSWFSYTYVDAYPAQTPLAPPASRTTVTDRRGAVREVLFNGTGYVTQSTQAKGQPEQQITTYIVDSDGYTTSMTDPLLRNTKFEYTNGYLTKTTWLADTATPVSTSLTMDPVLNKPKTLTDANKHTTTLDYYANGDLKTVTDALQHVVATFEYDGQGRLKTASNAYQKAVTYGYTGPDVTSVKDPLGRTMGYGYDTLGRLWSASDPLGNTAYFDYDDLNRLKTITDPLQGTTSFDRDATGFVTKQTDPNSSARSFTPTPMGMVDTMTDALTKPQSNQYEPGGKLKQIIDRKGQLSAIAYDILGRPQTLGFGASSAAPTAFRSQIALTWDKGNRLTDIEDRVCSNPSVNLNCSVVASRQLIHRVFDSLDRLQQETTPQGEVHYTYDDGGRRKTMWVVNGPAGSQTTQPTITYTWDDADRLTKIEQAAGALNGNVKQTVQITPDDAGRRVTTTLSNGATINYVWDDASQLKSVTYRTAGGAKIGDLIYGYDNAGRRISVGGTFARVTLPSGVTTTKYDANNRLTKWGTAVFGYDDNGNLLSDGTLTYTWNERNQLTGISNGATPQAGFQYDGSGRRVGKTIGSTTTGYVYDGDNFVQELSGTTNAASIRAQLITGDLDEAFLRMEGGVMASLLTDGNNNTVRLIDGAQAKITDYAYEPYGATSSDVANNNTQQYTGRENDNPGNAFGLYYYRNRFYMPGCERFISEDPIGWVSGQTNNYAYVGGNPNQFRDPYGLYCLSEGAMGAIGGGIGGAFAGAVNGFAMAGIPGMFVMGGLGALGGAAAGYIGTEKFESGGLGGAAAGMMASAGTWKSDLLGGAVGGIVATDLTQSGMRDTHAGIIGGGVAGAFAGATAGFLKNELLKGAGMGGLAGVAGAALGSAVTEGLRFFNSCD